MVAFVAELALYQLSDVNGRLAEFLCILEEVGASGDSVFGKCDELGSASALARVG